MGEKLKIGKLMAVKRPRSHLAMWQARRIERQVRIPLTNLKILVKTWPGKETKLKEKKRDTGAQ